MKTRRNQNESGIALILTLTILAVTLILLLAFVTSMRTERMSAKAFSDETRARLMAEGAVDEAVALLQSAATNITPNTSYVTAPGVVYTRTSTGWAPPTQLFTSGTGVDLNTNNYITGTGPTYTPGTPIPVGWESITSLPSPGNNPELIGRIAYWVDDESTKVDLNLAQKRTADPSGYTPAAIDLTVPQLFGPGNGVGIINYVNTRPFDTIESLKLAPPGMTFTEFSKNQFYVTVNSTSPDLTPWGSKRLNVNALANSANTMVQKQAAVVAIAAALATNTMGTWYGGGQTFATKYNVQPTEVQQIAANIIDYIRTDVMPTDSSPASPAWQDTTPPAYLGLKETPYLNELVITNTFTLTPTTPPAGQLTITTTISVELWYMYTNSAGWTPPANTTVTIMNIPTIKVVGGASAIITPATVTINGPVFKHMPFAGNPYLVVGKVVVQTPTPIPVPDTTKLINAALSPTVTPPVTVILTSPVGRMDYAQVPLPANTIHGQVVPGSPLNLVWAAQCNDPRVKPVSNKWKQNTVPGTTTLGAANNNTIDVLGGAGPTLPGDGDMSCHIVSANPGTTGRQRGAMYPSELAYIHTGVPWRTLWLEPQQNAEGTVVPDWLAVDLFSTTDMTNVPGRMNINAQLNIGSGTIPNRTAPLDALVGNAAIGEVANIYNVNLITPPTLPQVFSASAFTTAGEICQVKGIADGGGLKSVRELPAQEILNIVTPRSDTFTIWAIAQSIKKVNNVSKTFVNGQDLITGEVKVQAVVQRYEDPNALPGTLPAVRFRTLYYRYIYQ